jgi:ferredoxin
MKIKVNTVEAEFIPEQHKNLLEALEQQGFEPHSHCRDGFCGACRCKLLKGSVSYTLEPIAFIHNGEILTCCAVPDNEIELDLEH